MYKCLASQATVWLGLESKCRRLAEPNVGVLSAAAFVLSYDKREVSKTRLTVTFLEYFGDSDDAIWETVFHKE